MDVHLPIRSEKDDLLVCTHYLELHQTGIDPLSFRMCDWTCEYLQF